MSTEKYSMLPYRKRLPKLSLAAGYYRVMDIATLAAPEIPKADLFTLIHQGNFNVRGTVMKNPITRIRLSVGDCLTFLIDEEGTTRLMETIDAQ